VRALVVDDSRAIRSIIGKVLRESGFEVSEAAHGREALDHLRSSGLVELAMVDWNMPEMNGYEFVCAVRANLEWAGMRIVMVTTETEMAQVARALAAGANEYIMKPFTRDILQEKLQLLGLSPV
jgi:two-component system chemotaxis response regulator CheY